MSHRAHIAYFAHSIRSDWNNGNVHFLRGLLRELVSLGHQVTIFEPIDGWSVENLAKESEGSSSLQHFASVYPELIIRTYRATDISNRKVWIESLREIDIVLVHEWNPPELGHTLQELRDDLHYRLIFHDTHHRASSSPEQIRVLGIELYDGVLAFGETLSSIYRNTFHIQRVWTLHEAADTRVFKPVAAAGKQNDVVWIGNWGDNERSTEITQYLLEPALQLPDWRFTVYGVRYPVDGLSALHRAGVRYCGYLSNLEAPAVYAASRLTVHIPRQQYVTAMVGIPTIRIFEALACGIPLISAPWQDAEKLFRDGDYLAVRNASEMRRAMEYLLNDVDAAHAQALRGLETVLARHTCRRRAEQLSSILEESFG